MASRKLIVEIVGDSRSLDRTFAKASRNGKRFQSEMTAALGGGGVNTLRGNVYGAAAVAAGAAVFKLSKQASDLNEQIERSKVVFGDSAQGVEDWSRTLATSFGLAQTEAITAADNFGTMFRTIGLGGDDAATMSRRLVELGADMASFADEPVTDMLDRLRSGLAGEAEPLRRFGVLLSEADVKAEAYRSGIARVGAALSEQQKVQARYQLILRQTVIQQGDFARSSDRLSGQTKELRAQVNNLATRVGEKLLPKMTELVTAANDGITAIGNLANVLSDFGKDVEGASKATDGFAGRWLKFALQVSPAGSVYRAMWAFRQLTKDTVPATDAPFSVGPRGAPGAMQRLRAAQAAAAMGKPATAEQRNQWFDAMIGRRVSRVQDIQSLQGQISELRQIAALIERRIAVTKDITRRLTLEDALLDVQRQIKANQEAIKARQDALREERRLAAEERREREKQAREEAAERARQARLRTQFGLLGLTATGDKPLPTMANLRKQLEALSRRIAGTAVGTRNRGLMNAIRKALLKDNLEDEVREKIRDIFQAIREELGHGVNNLKTNWGRKVDPTAFVDALGLNLTPAQRRTLMAGVATLGPGGTTTPGTSRAFVGGGVVVNGDLVLNGVQNTRQLEAEIARRSRSRPKNRRGAS